MTIMLVFTAGGLAAGELDVLPLGDAERAFALGSGHTGEIVDARSGETVSVEQMAEAMASARVVLIGEDHTHLGQKHLHGRILDALAEVQPNLVLGMEFFRRSDREVLDRWGAGEIEDDDLLKETEWYDRGTYRWGYYRPIMDVARRRGIPVVGLNVPREIPRTVNRRGLDALSDDQKAEIGEVSVEGSPQHRYLIGRYFGDTVAMMPPQWFDNMYAAQCVWDVVMARSILDVLPEGGTVVVVVGAGHVAYDLGIVRRILAEAGGPAMEVATFCPVQAPIPPEESDEPTGHPMGGDREGDTGPQAVFARSLADFVGVFESTGGVEAWPTLGLRLKEGEAGTPMVSMVWPDSFAEDAGFASGDEIVDLNGRSLVGLSDLRWKLAGIEWGDRVDLRVLRGEETLDLAIVLAPQPVAEDRETAPGWTVEPVEPFGLGATEVVVADESPEPTTVLVSQTEGPSWAVTRLDGVPQAMHTLDDAGRILRSVFLEPQVDGAVEVVYTRDETGTITEILRLGRGQ